MNHRLLVARGTWGSIRAIDKSVTCFTEAVRIDVREYLDDAHGKGEGGGSVPRAPPDRAGLETGRKGLPRAFVVRIKSVR